MGDNVVDVSMGDMADNEQAAGTTIPLPPITTTPPITTATMTTLITTLPTPARMPPPRPLKMTCYIPSAAVKASWLGPPIFEIFAHGLSKEYSEALNLLCKLETAYGFKVSSKPLQSINKHCGKKEPKNQ